MKRPLSKSTGYQTSMSANKIGKTSSAAGSGAKKDKDASKKQPSAKDEAPKAPAPEKKSEQAQPKERTKITSKPVRGKLLDWKGKFGWVSADDKIEHPEAEKHKGKIFLAEEDAKFEIPGKGSILSFIVYTDGDGLGAMSVKVEEAVAKPAPKPKEKKEPKPAAVKDDKPKKLNKDLPAPDKSGRSVVTSLPVKGTVKKGAGQVFFIKPDDPVDHADAKKHKGYVYLHASDIDDEEAPMWNAKVMFFVYSDGKGLGAERCSIVEQGTEAMYGRRRKSKKAVAKAKAKAKAKGKSKSKAKAKSKKPKEPKGPSGPDLPRERITKEPVTGEVVQWKNRFGWIKPEAPIDHAAAEKHGGKIYVNAKDIAEGSEMATGSKVKFHVFADEAGLGAEQCKKC